MGSSVTLYLFGNSGDKFTVTQLFLPCTMTSEPNPWLRCLYYPVLANPSLDSFDVSFPFKLYFFSYADKTH